MLERNCEIQGDRAKTLKFAEVAEIREYCESHNAREKLTALAILTFNLPCDD